MTQLARSIRQSFLGEQGDMVLAATTVGVVGVSGGGSHVAQQLAHVGYGTIHLIDFDVVEEHHRHRLVGISTAAVRRSWPKVDVLRRLMRRVHPTGRVIPHRCRWQDVSKVLLECDIVVACLDGYQERDELERFLRRYYIPMIDIGMDVAKSDLGYQVRGQVIVSVPRRHCMRCFGFIRDDVLRLEAANYGAAGPAPQVVWPNGTLASTAVGIATAMILPWHTSAPLCPYLVYDGNRFELKPSPRLAHLPPRCSHYPIDEVPGDIRLFDISAAR